MGVGGRVFFMFVFVGLATFVAYTGDWGLVPLACLMACLYASPVASWRGE